MTRHFSEAELLETYYTQPGESMPVMMHLASCADCAARYERLERKLRNLASCAVDEKPQTFWARQRLMIMRGIEARKQHGEGAARTWRVAAAAVLAFILGGAVVYKSVEPKLASPPAIVQQQPAATPDDPQAVVHDAWQSDELKDFHGMVQWESWVDTKNDAKRENSL
jgi:hypothetical protein